MIETAKLVDGSDELVLIPSDTVGATELDLGFPEIRSVVDLRTQHDGTTDDTAFHGDRAVSLTVDLVPSGATKAVDVLDQLRAFLRPSRRPWLVFKFEGQDERKVQLRVDQHDAPVTAQLLNSVIARFVWRAPEGRIYSTVSEQRSVNPGGGTEEGRSYPTGGRTYDRTYPAYFGAGSIIVDNDGTTETDPVIRVFGPVTDPVIENETLGKQLQFAGLSIAGGEYVEIRPADRTVRSNGSSDPAANRYSKLDFANSDWWGLVPGRNVLRFNAATFASPALMEVTYSAAWL